MVLPKQKSIFDKAPVKVLQKEKAKEEFIPFEESIFALNKKSKVIDNIIQVEDTTFCKKSNDNEYVPIEDTIFCQLGIYKDSDEEDNKFLVHDDEVPFEESIFAKPKKSFPIVFRVPEKNKIDYEALFNKYKELYMNEYISNVKRLNMIDSDIYNNCCVLLEESRKIKVMNVESYDIVKRVIKSVCTCIEDAFYCYTNLNATLINLVTEVDSSADTITIYHIIDRSYAEVIDEFGGRNGKDC